MGGQCKSNGLPEVPGQGFRTWNSHWVHAVRAVLSTHHVDEGCGVEIGAVLEYPLTPKTQNTWQEASARGIEEQERLKVARGDGLEVASIDECKLGASWADTVTDTATDNVCACAVHQQHLRTPLGQSLG